ncbi:hypothetical protein [Amycolatopsis keratiniphila]|uniref:Secreted protein n=1 Tax=Amycolatopsis keratiniphila TaxID=129921 RepID=R4SX81_9PSEU|nr:hypothetical protein [Amycolatopsis keratiniphila]AGM04761.1 hypothetical protein AORI_2173 [Amycolatopsis keratiniphila]
MRINRKIGVVAGTAAGAALLFGGIAQAYTLDPATGTGFVGKGEVQTPFGWNNAKLQANASGVSFTYDETGTYAAVCTWVTGEGTKGEKTHNVAHATSTSVANEVTYDARVKTQITGFTLKGFSTTTTTGEIPLVGEACPGNPGTNGTWTSVTETGSTGGLYVHYGTATALLTPTAPVV